VPSVCRSFLRSVDKALVWENNRYGKVVAKIAKRRAALKKRSASLTVTQVGIKAQMEALEAAIDQENISQEDGDRLVAEYNALIPVYEENDRSLQTVTDTLDGLKFEFSEARKLHRSNVKSTVKYRKQVATYCKRF
jgi:hypothetical protein